jgi:alkanesulfonate monooxygenase SsuD/methylene tetrahydromethanopterin reductase-like flavin-dependent oxidoreductase (luciferase family)
MEFAVMNLFPNPQGKTEKEVLNEALEEFMYAEELGFDSVWLAEHHFSEYGILGNPLLFASLLAAKTKRIRIGTAVMILPFYNPIRLAEDAALVDLMSDGRLDLGIGRGYQPKEFKGFNINPSESRDRFNESVDILEQAWTQDEVNYHGQYFQFEGIQVHPRPTQKPHIPLHFAAVSTETYEIMGKAGRPIITSPNFTPVDIIKRNFDIYKSSLTENGYNPENYKFPLAQQIHVARSSEEAKMKAVKNSKEYYNLLASLLPGSSGEDVADEYKFFKKVQKSTEAISLEEIDRNGGNFGSPQEVIERIKYLEKEVGVNQYICWFNFGQIGHKETMKTMELFAKEVMPAFQKSSAVKH